MSVIHDVPAPREVASMVRSFRYFHTYVPCQHASKHDARRGRVCKRKHRSANGRD